MSEQQEKQTLMEKLTIPRMVIEILILSMIAFLLLALPAAGYNFYSQNKIIRGVKIGSIDLGGKTLQEAYIILSNNLEILEDQGIGFVHEKKRVDLPSIVTSPTDPDLTYDLISYDPYVMLQESFDRGHADNVFVSMNEQIKTFLFGYNIASNIDIYDEAVINTLKLNFEEFETPAQEAALDIDDNLQITISEDKAGIEFDYAHAVAQMKENLANFDLTSDIQLTLKDKEPEITQSEAQQTIDDIRKVLEKESIVLSYEDIEHTIDRKVFKNFLGFVVSDDTVKVTFDTQSFDTYLDSLREEIDRPAQDARFEISDTGKVTEFAAAENGLELNASQTAKLLDDMMLSDQASLAVNLVVDQTEPHITELVNELGIQELIAVGTSDFSGSPYNRRHNIKVGADTLNGILLAPGQEFSLIDALGAIDGSNGYLQELVIKGDKTIPEYGGGLCQIGTTIFRAALDAGVPITERRNHSYAVSYYAPFGTDATIYSPKPDFRFLNDTPNHILIQTHMDGNELVFEFWGTDDGRTSEITDPVHYNWVAPPPTKIIYTDELEPGKKRCTESAHSGLTAYFDRTVTMADGEVKEERFTSHYRPWQAVCLVGRDPNDPEQGGEPATDGEESTEPVEQAAQTNTETTVE